ncbi:hypothetical protein [Cupriavidus basilensis]|uniref:hypothetical protein n=1 Tax=Cupriavidus basilensis TaxID=68895 RepID=UPI0023E850D5|nr:hypothetical protein [Cupriavidus basilensis]MDF3886689.1 hypothetical protein [Cupriavidus basilensis]
MKDIQLDVTLSVVGPRKNLLSQPKWPMALRVCVGFSGESANKQEAMEMIAASLPWNQWNGGLPEITLVDGNGKQIQCVPEPPAADEVPFLQFIMDSVEKRGRALYDASVLNFSSAGGQHHDVEDDAGVSKVSWPGLLSTLSTLHQPTPSALKTTWFFHADVGSICQIDPATGALQTTGVKLSAAPVELSGKPISNVQFGNGAAVFEYAGDVRCHCNAMVLDEVIDHGLDELDNYWMTIRDSRDDSVLDLAPQLDAALNPTAMLGAMRFDEWLSLCLDPVTASPCTSAQLTQALDAWRSAFQSADKEAMAALIASARKTVIENMLKTPGEPAETLRKCYRDQVEVLLDAQLQAIRAPVVVGKTALQDASALLAERLLPGAFQPAETKPSKTGECVALVVGDERLRLVHEDVSKTSALDEVAAIQLWGRRSTDPAAFDIDAPAPAAWHALGAGRYASQDDPAAVGANCLFGAAVGYVDGVLYREYAFAGNNVVCRNPLDQAHREEMGDGDPGMRLVQMDRVAVKDWQLKPVPLRYGDHYEFAASIIDRAGGQADELTKQGLPWLPDLERLARLDPPQRDTLHFLRRVSLGACALVPANGHWPSPPAGAVLRGLEHEPAPTPGQSTVPVLLVPADPEHFKAPAGTAEKRAGWPTEVRFDVVPPQIDEHTAMRWFMPPTNVSRAEQEAARAQLVEVIGKVLEQREVALATGSSAQGLIQDPAVDAVGIEWTIDGDASTPARQVLPAERREFIVRIGEQNGFDHDHIFTVTPGAFLRITIHPLVSTANFARMDAVALRDHVEADPWTDASNGRTFRAFQGEIVIAECATHELPALDANLLTLTENPTGDIDVRYQFSAIDVAARAAFRHVDTMSLTPRQWVWRNLPLPPSSDWSDGNVSAGEWARRLASGPPLDLFDASKRDSSAEVSDFDDLCRIDTGFVTRYGIDGTFSREVANPAASVQGLDEMVLFRDGREGAAAAGYFQYTWTIRSRYASVLNVPERSTPSLRRIAVGFRGDARRIKPPRILAVMPLLSRMPESPRKQAQGDATPFLVVLDEIWFREYGLGERLLARIAKVKREEGEPEPVALRYGPLPDHSLDLVAATRLQGDSAILDVFGPFGFTLDRGNDQALANATGFVLYPPAKTPPHYNLFVEFERCLELPSGVPGKQGKRVPLCSEKTDALPMYTLPDSAELWPEADDPQQATLTLSKVSAGSFSYDANKLRLHPLGHADEKVMLQYRHLLIVGSMVRDGGRAVDVFLPSRALWLANARAQSLGGDDAALCTCTHAVVCEILLSGRFDPAGKHGDPLADAKGLVDLFKRMLPNNVDQDAPGMFRRFSTIGRVSFQ